MQLLILLKSAQIALQVSEKSAERMSRHRDRERVCVCMCGPKKAGGRKCASKNEGKSSKRHKAQCGAQALALGPVLLRPGSLAA